MVITLDLSPANRISASNCVLALAGVLLLVICAGRAHGACGDWLEHSESVDRQSSLHGIVAGRTLAGDGQLDWTLDQLDGLSWPWILRDARSGQPIKMPRPCRGPHCGGAPAAPSAMPAPTIPQYDPETLLILVTVPSDDRLGDGGYDASDRFSLSAGEPLAIFRPPRTR